MELRALGPVEAVVGGDLVNLGPPKQRALFALLLSRLDQPVAVDTLIEELWSGEPPTTAMGSLQVYISNLRRVLEPRRLPRAPAAVLRTRAPGYVLDSGAAEVDVHRFAEYFTTGHDKMAQGALKQALREFDAALGLWRGPAYADMRDAAWAAPEIARLQEMRLSVIEGRCAALLELGAHDMAVVDLETHMRAHPLRERGCQLLALALYRGGRQAEALDVLRINRVRLAEELGIDPGTALQRLERDILTQAPALDWPPNLMVQSAPLPQVAMPRLRPVERVAEGEVFVGREVVLQRLADALAAASCGRGSVVLLAGEPGIGKTRLLRHFADIAGIPVAWGACSEHVAAPPLWPWEQVLRTVRADYPNHLVPGPVAELLDGQSPQLLEVSDVAGAALRRFEAIRQYLTTAPDPLVVILDDLHWTDLASLRLLAYLAETITGNRLVLIGSYRCNESAVLDETLAALARAGAGRIELSGLDVEETQALASAVVGWEVSKRTAERLWARTEGNPFFLRELVGLLASERHLDQPDMSPVPVPVREVVLRRVARLPKATAAVLSVAAIAGRDFDVEIVAEAGSVEVEAALEALDAAIAAGLVVENPQRLGWFSFTHALVAEALYEASGRLRRVRRHRRIGQAAARVWVGHPERAAEIARHWLLAAELDLATAAQASAYAAAAARVADARLAPEDAAPLWQQALATAALAGDDVDRYPLLMGLATSLYRAGNPRDGLPIFVQAMQHALTEDNPQDMARLVTATVGALCESSWYPSVGGVDDERLVDVLQRALLRLTDPVDQALLLSLLAVARYYNDDSERRIGLSNQALAFARPVADTVALARVLYLRALALHGPDYPEQCLDAVTELLGLAGLPPPLVTAARLGRAFLLATVGRISEAASELDRVALFVEQSGSPLYRVQLGWFRAGLLLLAGRWAEAELISRTTYNLHSEMSFGAEWGIGHSMRMIHRWEAAYLAGTGANLVDELRAAVKATGLASLRSILTMALVEAGHPEDARALLRHFAPGPKNFRWLYTQCWGLLAAARLGDIELATRLREQLLPYRRLPCALFAAVVSGSVAYFTGEAALVLGDPHAALADFTIATKIDERMGAWPWLAQARNAITHARSWSCSPEDA
jgi:DNA-binding SARP family transcriptional activator